MARQAQGPDFVLMALTPVPEGRPTPGPAPSVEAVSAGEPVRSGIAAHNAPVQSVDAHPRPQPSKHSPAWRPNELSLLRCVSSLLAAPNRHRPLQSARLLTPMRCFLRRLNETAGVYRGTRRRGSLAAIGTRATARALAPHWDAQRARTGRSGGASPDRGVRANSSAARVGCRPQSQDRSSSDWGQRCRSPSQQREVPRPSLLRRSPYLHLRP